MTRDTTFILRTEPDRGDGPRLAVKDAIDVAGVPTTDGCPAVGDDAPPAERDATCVAVARAAGARIVGKANLHELCFGPTGLNEWYGNPVNPLDPDLVPGGSSSGSAVAVATGEADVALGTDTNGSVRTPAGCCGVVGLRTTWGRVPLDGVCPLAPTLDTVGPMAATVGGVVLGMQLLEPGFTVRDDAPRVVGRVRVPDIDPVIERALDDALARTEVEVVEIELPGFDHAIAAARTIMFGEAWHSFGDLFRRRPERIGRLTTARIELARAVTNDQLSDAREFRARWRAATSDVFTRVEVLALPTLHRFPARVDDADEQPNPLGSAAALAGVPALSLPVPSTGPVPASLQLIGPSGAEDRLLALGLLVESATP